MTRRPDAWEITFLDELVGYTRDESKLPDFAAQNCTIRPMYFEDTAPPQCFNDMPLNPISKPFEDNSYMTPRHMMSHLFDAAMTLEIAERDAERRSTTHAIQRDSPKGDKFVGHCVLCGARNLSAAQLNELCDNPDDVTEGEALIRAIEGE